MIFLKLPLSVSAIVLFIATASFAEGGAVPGEQAEATAMPTPLFGASQKAQSTDINAQAGVNSAAADAKANANPANNQTQPGQPQHISFAGESRR